MKRRLIFVLLFSLVRTASAEPPPPKHVRAEQQDMQAVRITWDYDSIGVGYNLYASYDVDPPDFHKENDQPLKQNYVIWDGPREGYRKFVFYITAVDPQGYESDPSKYVRVEIKALH